MVHFVCMSNRTKWKRQTAVGLELLAEAGNFAAVQRMLQSSPYWLQQLQQYAGPSLVPSMASSVGSLGGGAAAGLPNSPFDMYYRGMAAAAGATVQKGPGPTSLTSPGSGSIYSHPHFSSLYSNNIPSSGVTSSQLLERPQVQNARISPDCKLVGQNVQQT